MDTSNTSCKPTAGVRYYVYVSRAKVEMLHPQIPRNTLARLTALGDIEAKVAFLSLRLKHRNESGLVQKLAAVARFLHHEGLVGTATNPRDYIHDMCELRTSIPLSRDNDQQMADLFDFVLWGDKQLGLSLVGSRQNLVGEPVVPKRKSGNYSQLRHVIQLVQAVERAETRTVSLDQCGPYVANQWCDRGWLIDGATVRNHANRLNSFLAGPPCTYEFLAKVLLYDSHDPRGPGLIATPLYVALAKGSPQASAAADCRGR